MHPIIEQVTPVTHQHPDPHQSCDCAIADRIATLRAERDHLKRENAVLLAMQALIDAKAAKHRQDAQVRRDVALACGEVA